MRRRASTAGLLAAVFLLSGPACAADAPYAGTWKVVILPGRSEMSWFIVNVEDKGSGPKMELVSALKDFKQVKLRADKAEGGALRFSIDDAMTIYKFAVYPPKGDKQPKKILGSVEFRGSRYFARLERTEDKEIDSANYSKPAPGTQDWTRAINIKDAREKAAALNETIEKNPASPVAYLATVELAGVLPETGARDEDVKAIAEKAIGIAADYGPEMKDVAVVRVAVKLITSKKAPALAVEYARRVLKGLPAGAPPAAQIPVLKTLNSALKQADMMDQVKEVGERLAKLETALDDEYLKDAVPFKVEPFARERPNERVVLVELFTGAHCLPCIAADVAFDAALKSYKPRDVILLQYHTNIPELNLLINADADKRAAYYSLGRAPSTYVAGGTDLRLGGDKAKGKDSYSQLANAIKERLDGDAPAKIDLTAKQIGDDIVITATVSDLKHLGEDTKLRLVLIEEAVRYPGTNRQRIHHHVVRAMPGGVEGFALKEATAKQQVKVNLADLKKSLAKYLEAANHGPFLDDEPPLDLKHLIVVAFIQNDRSKEVLQATQADVHAEK
jgi:hypothetical protein